MNASVVDGSGTAVDSVIATTSNVNISKLMVVLDNNITTGGNLIVDQKIPLILIEQMALMDGIGQWLWRRECFSCSHYNMTSMQMLIE